MDNGRKRRYCEGFGSEEGGSLVGGREGGIGVVESDQLKMNPEGRK